MRDRMKRNFDERHRAKSLKPLSPGDMVWIREKEAGGTVERETNTRLYTVQTEEGVVRRNHRDLILVPDSGSTQVSMATESSVLDQGDHDRVESETSATTHSKTHSGRVSKPPERFVYFEKTVNLKKGDVVVSDFYVCTLMYVILCVYVLYHELCNVCITQCCVIMSLELRHQYAYIYCCTWVLNHS